MSGRGKGGKGLGLKGVRGRLARELEEKYYPPFYQYDPRSKLFELLDPETEEDLQSKNLGDEEYPLHIIDHKIQPPSIVQRIRAVVESFIDFPYDEDKTTLRYVVATQEKSVEDKQDGTPKIPKRKFFSIIWAACDKTGNNQVTMVYSPEIEKRDVFWPIILNSTQKEATEFAQTKKITLELKEKVRHVLLDSLDSLSAKNRHIMNLFYRMPRPDDPDYEPGTYKTKTIQKIKEHMRDRKQAQVAIREYVPSKGRNAEGVAKFIAVLEKSVERITDIIAKLSAENPWYIDADYPDLPDSDDEATAPIQTPEPPPPLSTDLLPPIVNIPIQNTDVESPQTKLSILQSAQSELFDSITEFIEFSNPYGGASANPPSPLLGPFLYAAYTAINTILRDNPALVVRQSPETTLKKLDAEIHVYNYIIPILKADPSKRDYYDKLTNILRTQKQLRKALIIANPQLETPSAIQGEISSPSDQIDVLYQQMVINEKDHIRIATSSAAFASNYIITHFHKQMALGNKIKSIIEANRQTIQGLQNPLFSMPYGQGVASNLEQIMLSEIYNNSGESTFHGMVEPTIPTNILKLAAFIRLLRIATRMKHDPNAAKDAPSLIPREESKFRF